MSWPIELGLLVVLALANGVFAGAEIAIVSVRASRLRELLAGRSRSAEALHALRVQPERFLATVQIGITLIGASAAAFGGATLASELTGPLVALGVSEGSAREVALVGVVLLVSYLSLVLGELVPKSLALKWSERYALVVARPLQLLSRLAAPLVWLLTSSSNLVLRLFGDRTNFSESRISRVELLDLVEQAADAGEVHPLSGDIAERAIELDSLHVSALMVPREAVRMLPEDADMDELVACLDHAEEAHFPVTRGDDDEVIGYVTMRDLARLVARRVEGGLTAAVHAIHAVPENAMAVAVLETLQTRREPIALVVDESGATAGLVEMDDLVEEVIGTVVGAPAEIERCADGSAVVPASTKVHVANRSLGLALPMSPRWSTLNGLLTAELGVLAPPPGTRHALRDGTVIEVLESSPRRVQRVRVRPPA
jgi:putative hemolysin